MKILIQCGDHFENIKRIYSLAINLKEAGHTPIVMVYKNESEYFFISRGIDTISLNIKKTHYLTKLKYKYKNDNDYLGIPIDRVLDCDVRKNPHILSSTRKFNTRLNAIRYIKRVNEIVDEVSPDVICIWNGLTGLVANSLRLISDKRKLKCYFLERGLYKDSLFIDRSGVNGFSNLSSINQAGLGCSVEIKKIILKHRKVFIPLQVQSDTNIIYNSPFLTMREFILHIYELYSTLNIELIVRPHPEEVETDLNLPNLPGITYTTENSVDYWIENTDATITINSTVGLESIIKDKPTFSFGRSIYSNKKASIDVKSGSEIVNYFKKGNYTSVSGKHLLNYIEDNHIITQDQKCSVFNTISSDSTFTVNEHFKLFNHIKILPSEYEKQRRNILLNVKSNITGKSKIHIYTDISHNDSLNLTYRKLNEPINIEYIQRQLRELLERSVDKNNISISRTKKNSVNAINIYLSKKPKINTHNKWDVVVDKYFNVII